jgi:hypothetical protein
MRPRRRLRRTRGRPQRLRHPCRLERRTKGSGAPIFLTSQARHLSRSSTLPRHSTCRVHPWPTTLRFRRKSARCVRPLHTATSLKSEQGAIRPLSRQGHASALSNVVSLVIGTCRGVARVLKPPACVWHGAPQIAPSVMMLANLDQLLLPDVASVPAPAASATTPAPPPPPPGEAAAAAPPPPPPPPAAAAPPPPPPPPPPAAAEAGNGPPPPPPPPAPPPPPPSGGASDDDSGGRAGLLDAIKNPQLGKNRLKGAVNKVVKAKKTAVVAGDFMSQMRDKMEARRAAMAGGPEDPAAGRASVASAASDEAEPEAKPQVASVRESNSMSIPCPHCHYQHSLKT